MPKKGTEYELFVKEVYECLNKADGLTDVDIRHDVKLTGVAGVEHQIDVFWTFKRGGVSYRVAVECKDYKSHVSKEKIEAFHLILNDIGNVYRIFVSKMGFQSGAREYASKYGIQLMEIRQPVESDWKGRIKDIHIELSVLTVGNVRPQIFVSKDRADEMGISLPEETGFHAWTNEVIFEFSKMTIEDENFDGYKSASMVDIINKLPRAEFGEGKQVMVTFVDGLLNLKGSVIPIDAIEFTYDICESKENINIYGDDVIKAIVKNITEGTETHIDKFGAVSVFDGKDE